MDGPCRSVGHKKHPGHPVSVLDREVNMNLPLLLSHEPGKKRAAQPLAGKLTSSQAHGITAIKKQDWGSHRGASSHMEEAQTSQRYRDDGKQLYLRQVTNIPLAALEGPMCTSFHGSYPVCMRPTRREQQEPGSLKTHPHRAAWLAAKGLTSLTAVPATGIESNERSWRRNEDEDADFLAFIETLLDDRVHKMCSMHTSIGAAQRDHKV